jgi:hypothetical protein
MLVNCGKSIETDVRVEDLPKPVLDHVIYIGLRKILGNLHAGKSLGDARTEVEAKLSAMYSGDVRATAVRGVKADPLTPAMVDMAAAIVRARDIVELSKLPIKRRNRVIRDRARSYIEEHETELRALVEVFLALTLPATEPPRKGSPK